MSIADADAEVSSDDEELDSLYLSPTSAGRPGSQSPGANRSTNELRQLEHLEILNISHNNLPLDELRQVLRLRSLRHLDLLGNPGCHDATFDAEILSPEALKKLRKLQTINGRTAPTAITSPGHHRTWSRSESKNSIDSKSSFESKSSNESKSSRTSPHQSPRASTTTIMESKSRDRSPSQTLPSIGCTCHTGVPCEDKAVCDHWNNRFEVAKQNRRRRRSRGK